MLVVKNRIKGGAQQRFQRLCDMVVIWKGVYKINYECLSLLAFGTEKRSKIVQVEFQMTSAASRDMDMCFI